MEKNGTKKLLVGDNVEVRLKTTMGLPLSSENGGLEPFLTFPLKTNSDSLESRGNNLDMAITNADCSSTKEISTCTLEDLEATIQGASGRRASCGGVSSGSFKKESASISEKGSGQGTVDVNEGKGSCLADEIDIDQSVKVHGGDRNLEVKDKTLCEEYDPSRASKTKWQPVSKTFLPRAEYCPQALLSDYIFKFKKSNSDQKGLEDQKIESGRIKPPFKEVELKAKKHLLAVGWRFECKTYYKNKKRLRTRYVSPKGKFYNSLPKACLALEEDGGGMVGNVIDDLGGSGHHSNCGCAQTLVTLSPKPNSIAQEQTDDSILKVNLKLREEQASSVIDEDITENRPF